MFEIEANVLLRLEVKCISALLCRLQRQCRLCWLTPVIQSHCQFIVVRLTAHSYSV